MDSSNSEHAPQGATAKPPYTAEEAQNAAHALLSELPAVRISEIRTGFGTATVFLHGLIRRPVESDDANDRELIVAMLRSALGDRIYNGAW